MNRFLSTVIAGAAGGLFAFGAAKFMNKGEVALPAQPTPTTRQVSYGGTVAPFDFTKAAEKTMDAVVHIKASESQQSARQRQRSDPWSHFFGESFGYEPQPRSGTGSGVIYTTDGYIMTNNHVIEFADEYLVTMHDGREFKARLVGRDESTDMAVIKVDADKNLPAIELGNSDDVRVGEWALAVGNPFDLTSTVTAGIISAKGRDIDIIKKGSAIESFIQTDAAVNPGNSGGALVDLEGRLIGINSAIATPTGTFAGYAFAIPVNLAKRIVDDLIKYGEYRRGYLGVDIAPMNQDAAEELDLKNIPGLVVLRALPDGSAAQAGIQAKDIITKINGKNVTTSAELRELIGRSKIGETINLTIVRNEKEKDVAVRLMSRKNN
jgi:serine protease Do